MQTVKEASRAGTMYAPLPEGIKDGRVTAHAVQTINAGAEELYKVWSDVSSFPRWQEHVISVTPTSDKTSHWVIGNPEEKDGKRVEFDSEITEDIQGEKIAWKSISPEVEQYGSVMFEEAASGRGTLVTLIQTVKVPAGRAGNAVAALASRSPAQTVKENLRHFKEMAESGEVPSVAGQPHGPRGVVGGLKEWMYGETNPTPPGTSDRT